MHMFNLGNTFLLWMAGIIFVALIDFIVLIIARLKKSNFISENIDNDYSVLVPIFNNSNYLKNIPFLEQYANKVYILTSNKETQEFNENIERICNKFGFKLFKADIEDNQEKTPWLLFSIALHGKAGDKDMINSSNIILLDGDTHTDHNLGNLVATMNENKFDLSSVKIVPAYPSTLAEKLQSIEYYIAMQARLIFPYLTSGAALIGRKDALKRIYARHSMFFQAGDIEVGIISKKIGYRVGYIPFEFYTEVPGTFKALTKQRLSWASGTFRLFVVNIFQNLRNHPWEIMYTCIMVYLFAFFKVYNFVLYFPLIAISCYSVYVFILSIIMFNEFSLIVILSPIYSFIQSVLILPFGAIIYLRRVIMSHNIGWINIADPKRNAKLLVGNHSLYSNALELSKPRA
jgi:cellulose synthase/poly-beta-1,6-N-acetylglucosamine synthase-like glycosyltransferase